MLENAAGISIFEAVLALSLLTVGILGVLRLESVSLRQWENQYIKLKDLSGKRNFTHSDFQTSQCTQNQNQSYMLIQCEKSSDARWKTEIIVQD